MGVLLTQTLTKGILGLYKLFFSEELVSATQLFTTKDRNIKSQVIIKPQMLNLLFKMLTSYISLRKSTQRYQIMSSMQTSVRAYYYLF